MKVLLLNGSPHKKGCTFVALNEMVKVFEEKGIEAELVQVGNLALPGCVACGFCGRNGRCVRNDIVNELAPKFEAADGLVVGSPDAVCMAFELATYGAVSGLLYRVLPRKPWSVYAALLAAMVAGRLVWGLVKWLLLGLAGSAFTMEMFLAGALLNAIPGIILHIVLIPIVVLALEKAGLVENRPKENA